MSGWQFGTHCLPTLKGIFQCNSHLFKVGTFHLFQIQQLIKSSPFLIFLLAHLQFASLLLIAFVLSSNFQGLVFHVVELGVGVEAWRRDCLCQRSDFDRMASNQSQRSEFDDIRELGGVLNSSLVRQQQSLLLAVNLLFLYSEDIEPAGYCHTNPII